MFPYARSTLLPILLGLVVLSYLNTLYSPTVLDDASSFIRQEYLYNNDISVEALRQLASTRFGLTRLIPLATFSLDFFVGKGSIVQFHITNILIHLFATAACFVFLTLLWRQQQSLKNQSINHVNLLTIFFAVAVWSLNPVQTNAVTYIVQRMTSLATLFYLLALSGYLSARTANQPFRKIVAWFFFAVMACAGFLCKENSATLPVSILLIEEFFVRPGTVLSVVRSSLFRRLLPLALIVLVVLLPVVTVFWERWIASGYHIRHFTMEQRLLTELRVVVFYITLFLLPLPSRLNLDHDFPLSHSFFSPISTFGSLLLLGGLLIVAIKLRRSHRLFSFGILWFFLHLIIESTFVPLELVFEHRLYLPSVGLAVSLAAIVENALLKSRNQDRARILFLFTLIIASLLTLMTTLRNHAWSDVVSINHDAVLKSPAKARTYCNYGMALMRNNQFKEALPVLEKAISLGRQRYEEDVTSLTNIVVCYNRLGQYEKAVERSDRYLNKGLENVNLRSFAPLMYNRAYSFLKLQRYIDAYNAFAVGLHLAPSDNFLVRGMDFLFRHAANDAKAAEALGFEGEKGEEFIRLARVMMNVRRYDLAESYLQMAQQEGAPESIRVGLRDSFLQTMEKNNIARQVGTLEKDPLYTTSLKAGIMLDVVQFIMDYYPPLRGLPVRKILDLIDVRMEKESPFISLFRARSLKDSGKYEEAVDELQELISVNADFAPALYELGMTASQLGQKDLARQSLLRLLQVYPGHPQWYLIETMIDG